MYTVLKKKTFKNNQNLKEIFNLLLSSLSINIIIDKKTPNERHYLKFH